MLGILLLAQLGCADYSIIGIEKRVGEILVHPSHLNFGHLESGFESDVKYFTITNTGDDNLIITSPVLISGNSRFGLLEEYEGLDITIPGGEMLQVDISYTPSTYEANGAFVQFQTNDEDEPEIQVTLEGYGDAPVMTVTPLEFDYGDISIGCDNEERVTITNNGNLPLTVESITQMVTQPADILMEFGSLPEPPWELDPGHALDFLVSYIPDDVGYDESNIRILGNDPAKPEVEIIQYGDGDVEQWYTETHLQEEVPVLDVLWVVDDSGSMNRFQTNLSSNIGLFVSTFMATGADYHMSVITTSDASASPLITSFDVDPAGTLASYVMVGISGSGMEKGIQFAERALSSSTSVGPGSSFFRSDATLVVIYVSDEPDHSDGGWASYLSFFDSIKPAGQFIPYGVIGDYPGGCTVSSGFGGAQFGAGYWDMIDYYGGDWYSICASDWGVQLQDLANALTAKRSYPLEEPDPIISSIEVTVNGQITTEWEYSEEYNSVIFAQDSVPEEGQTITISYAVWGCGEEE
jgi:hypothetical protein